MATRYILVSALNTSTGIYKPSGTLGHHALQWQTLPNGKVAVRGIDTREQFVPIHLNGVVSIEKLQKLPVQDGRLGRLEYRELSPWMEVKTTDVLRYDCGEITICKGQFAALKRAELLGEEGASKALSAYLKERWESKVSKETSLSKEEIRLLCKEAGLYHGWRPKFVAVQTPPKEFYNVTEPEDYSGYRSMAEGAQLFEAETPISGHKVWLERHFGIDPYDRAWGSVTREAIFYVM